MFNWLISSKKDTPEVIDYVIPEPPKADWDLAVKIKKQKYNYLYRDNLNNEIIDEYNRRNKNRVFNTADIDLKLHNLLTTIVCDEIEEEFAFRMNKRNAMKKIVLQLDHEYNRRKSIEEARNLHKILLNMVNKEFVSEYERKIKYFEWASFDTEDDDIIESDDDVINEDNDDVIDEDEDVVESEEEFITKEYVNTLKRQRKETPVFDWNEKIKEWGIEEHIKFNENPIFDIEMGLGMEEIVIDDGFSQIERFKITEEDMNRISMEIGETWDDMPPLDEFYTESSPSKTYENYESTFNPLESPLNIECDLDRDDENFNLTVKENSSNIKMKVNKEHPEGYLELFIGPMFSGKSSKVVFKLSSMADQRFHCLYINSNKDVRKTESQDNFVTTHNSTYSQISPKIKCMKVSNLNEVSVTDFDYIGIDEFQFFNNEDAVRCVRDWVSFGKHVLIASLDGDCYRRNFGKILDLIPNADEVTKLTAYCDLCRDNYGLVKKAPFTARMTSDTTAELVGGSNLYKAMCRSCHDYHLKITTME